jgi:hypothetical protein
MPKRPLEVRVTEEHICRGRRRVANACPVALALTDAGLIDPFVDSDGVLHRVRGHVVFVALPDRATRFVNAFDAGLVVEPFVFALPIVTSPRRRT